MNSEIAISLSGGGFRAAMFHLGTLHYLNQLKYDDGRSFLDDVNTISTISGGTITGLWYMLKFCKGKDIAESIKELYHILVSYDLPTIAIEAITKDKTESSSLIREMVDIYDDMLFHGETFQNILGKIDEKHIHHFSANGTDFSNGYAFRFQASKKIVNAKPEFSRGFIGNKSHQIPWAIAEQIKLSEILAVSSCFPGGFEPMQFPKDFEFSKNPNNASYIETIKPYDLMDGGIVDNQGIEPLLLASEQMTYDNPKAQGNKKYPSYDLIIVSDVASPKLSENGGLSINLWKWMSLKRVNVISTLLSVSSIIFSVIFSILHIPVGVGASLASFVIFGLISTTLVMIEAKLLKSIKNNVPFKVSLRNVKGLSFYKIGKLAEKRLNSLLRLSQAVFMKPIRQMRYNALYNDSRWLNRCISNNVGELSSKGSWRWKKNFPDKLVPSDMMKTNSDLASTFGTTLWFTDEDKRRGVPEALFTSGQYTICMNLLEYIYKLKNNHDNTTEYHKRILSLETVLKNDWDAFQTNPKFMMI